MRMAEFHIEGFGRLADLSVRDIPPGLSIVLGDNEAGKMIEGKIRDSYEPNDEEARGGACRFRVNMTVKGDLLKAQPVLNVGSQHNAMTFGHWLPAIEEAGKLMDLEVVHLEY